MDLQFLYDFADPIVIGICLCVGYVIKTSLDFIPNKYIPLIMIILGMTVGILMHKGISGQIALSGMFSGLASTGLHQVFKNILNSGCNKDEKKQQDEEKK